MGPAAEFGSLFARLQQTGPSPAAAQY